MRRLAIFVEGDTELRFVDRLITEIARRNDIALHHQKIVGGGRDGKIKKRIINLQTPAPITGESLYVLIVDCGGEHLVPQRIREEHESLTKKGYERIIGIRDVYPNYNHDDIPRLRRSLRYAIKTKLAPVLMILSIMEVEAWFLAEYTHFHRIDSRITPAAIDANLGFNPETGDMSLRPEPTNDLVAAYALGGKVYRKGNANTTVAALDIDFIYGALADTIPDLKQLVATFDEFVTTVR